MAKRNKFSLSQYKLLTGDLGQLLPISLTEVLPGDSFLGHSSALVRTTPPLAPLMHPVQVRIHHWFCPTRLVFPEWEAFITGGNDGEGDGSTYPTISHTPVANDLSDYLGIPLAGASVTFSAIPVRIYNKIFNEAYRDQDLVSEVSEDTLDIQRVAWEKDYFTASRPWSQRGPEVTLPLGDEAPVKGLGPVAQTYDAGNQTVYESKETTSSTFNPHRDTIGTALAWQEDPDNAGFPDIYADLTNATAASVNDIREAFALQRYQEARARYGARYTEYLRYCGVVPSDARLQRPEYLGGGKQTISFSEVLQTSEPGTDPLGTLGGHGITAMASRKYLRYFTEHGFVMSLMSVRPKSMYTNGMFRHWNRRTKEDYFQKELQHIGQQEILNKEIFSDGSANDDLTFGWQDKYSEYRKAQSSIAAEFRSFYDFWHMARDFASLPTLNQSFTDCNPGKRFFAEQSQHSLLIMAQNTIKARRPIARTQSNRIY